MTSPGCCSLASPSIPAMVSASSGVLMCSRASAPALKQEMQQHTKEMSLDDGVFVLMCFLVAAQIFLKKSSHSLFGCEQIQIGLMWSFL